MESSVSIIRGKQLGIGYRTGKQTKLVHRNLNFELRQGELTCLLGANGAGKSTLLRTLAAAQPALEGSLELLGKPIHACSERERSRKIGVVLTDRTQTGGLTVYETGGFGPSALYWFFRTTQKEDKQKIAHALQAVGIQGRSILLYG